MREFAILEKELSGTEKRLSFSDSSMLFFFISLFVWGFLEGMYLAVEFICNKYSVTLLGFETMQYITIICVSISFSLLCIAVFTLPDAD
jgi:hypothetical protein